MQESILNATYVTTSRKECTSPSSNSYGELKRVSYGPWLGIFPEQGARDMILFYSRRYSLSITYPLLAVPPKLFAYLIPLSLTSMSQLLKSTEPPNSTLYHHHGRLRVSGGVIPDAIVPMAIQLILVSFSRPAMVGNWTVSSIMLSVFRL